MVQIAPPEETKVWSREQPTQEETDSRADLARFGETRMALWEWLCMQEVVTKDRIRCKVSMETIYGILY